MVQAGSHEGGRHSTSRQVTRTPALLPWGQTDPLHADWLMPAPTITACAPRTPPRLAAQELCATVSSLYVPNQHPLLTSYEEGLRGECISELWVKFFSTRVQTVPPCGTRLIAPHPISRSMSTFETMKAFSIFHRTARATAVPSPEPEGGEKC